MLALIAIAGGVAAGIGTYALFPDIHNAAYVVVGALFTAVGYDSLLKMKARERLADKDSS
ncbi:hypothetical protein [Desulfonatronovibrio hydrogenovorans]|uniref:hypothetical protein n=1 Tax=Desulfonatronovibrio hydrogenovorans TaxID=53245 RepID=UPI00048D0348|nr:hypothetical protein [Desulfonatronovibrio hydrogenovorans]